MALDRGEYVDKEGKTVVRQYDPKRMYMTIGIFMLVILIIIGSIIFYVKSKRNKVCTTIEDLVMEASERYARSQDLLPTLEGRSAVIQVNDLYDTGFLLRNEQFSEETVCNGTVKITKYQDSYIKTLDLENCDYCTTDTRYKDYGKEETTLSTKDKIVDVVIYYNYRTYDTYQSQWSIYFASTSISDEESEYGIKLTKDLSKLPKIPAEAEIIKYETEDQYYYRYRDKKWRYYKKANHNYSDFSSEQPSGYANKDAATVKQTVWSEWSLNYPEVKSYRTIETRTGCKWYYKENGKTIYYDGGAYLVDQPDDTYTKSENHCEKMYRYRDNTWRWYNGTKRLYNSQYTSVAPGGYPYRDEGFTQYSDWSKWVDASNLNDSNRYYREEQSDFRTRYRIVYQMHSLQKLETSLTASAFEEKVGMTLEEFVEVENTILDVEYRFMVRKKK